MLDTRKSVYININVTLFGSVLPIILLVLRFFLLLLWFLSHSKSTSKSFFLRSWHWGEWLLLRQWRHKRTGWCWLNWRLNLLFWFLFPSPFLISCCCCGRRVIIYRFFLFVFINLLPAPFFFRIENSLDLSFSLGLSLLSEWNHRGLWFSYNRLCSCDSTDTFESPFSSHLVIILSHQSLLLFLLLFVLFGQCLGSCDNLLLVIIRESLFEVSHILFIFLLYFFGLILNLRLEISHHLLNPLPQQSLLLMMIFWYFFDLLESLFLIFLIR